MITRINDLQVRLRNLKELLQKELKLKKSGKFYVSDLKESIAGCERELSF